LDHLRFSEKTEDEQRDALEIIVRKMPLLMEVLQGMREIDLPEWWVASGAIYNSVWNHLTNRPPETGIKDFDVIYFDDSDLSYEAEDEQIFRVDEKFDAIPIPIELRNQARTHIWYPGRFGRPYPETGKSPVLKEPKCEVKKLERTCSACPRITQSCDSAHLR